VNSPPRDPAIFTDYPRIVAHAHIIHAALGFSVTWRPFLSMPLLVAGAAVLVTFRRLRKVNLVVPAHSSERPPSHWQHL
jgi:hypothetical protein